MKYFFDLEENQERLRSNLWSWLGTPFRHRCGVKGMGCDCIHLITEVYGDTGVFDKSKIIFPNYSYGWNLHNEKEILYDNIISQVGKLIERIPNIRSYNFKPNNGDMLLYRFGKARSHVAIYFNGKVYQAVDGYGVEDRDWLDPFWHSKLTDVFRYK